MSLKLASPITTTIPIDKVKVASIKLDFENGVVEVVFEHESNNIPVKREVKTYPINAFPKKAYSEAKKALLTQFMSEKSVVGSIIDD